MTLPQISVVMPVFNAGGYLSLAIKSILSQSLGDFEFLIYDDGSTDGSIDILRAFAAADSRIKVHLGTHHGLTVWLNQGISDAVGAYIARMDADDIATPDRFALQASFLARHPDVAVVGGQALEIDPDGDPLFRHNLPLGHSKIDSEQMAGRSGMLLHPATMMRRQALLNVGGYRVEFQDAEDVDLWLRLAEIAVLANLPDVVLHYRHHPKSVSQTRRENQWSLYQRSIAEARERRHLPPTATVSYYKVYDVEWNRFFFIRSRTSGYYRTSRKYAWRIAKQTPCSIETWMFLASGFSARHTQRLKRAFHKIIKHIRGKTGAKPEP